MRDAILAQNIYCTNPNPDPDAHSGSQVRNELGARSPWSSLEYNLVAVIAIRMLTQPMTCEMGSSIFVAMSQLKVASTTSASLPTIPSTKRENGENFSVSRSKPARVCTYLFSLDQPKTCTFSLVSKSLRQHLQT